MSLKTLRFVFGRGVTHARITPDTTRIVPSGLMMFLIPVTEYILSMLVYTKSCALHPESGLSNQIAGKSIITFLAYVTSRYCGMCSRQQSNRQEKRWRLQWKMFRERAANVQTSRLF